MPDVDPELARIVQDVAGELRSLHVTKVNADVKRWFMEFANLDFQGHYGMALKWLIDYYTGSLPVPGEELNARLALIEQRLDKIESKPAEQEGRKPILNLRGETIGFKR